MIWYICIDGHFQVNRLHFKYSSWFVYDILLLEPPWPCVRNMLDSHPSNGLPCQIDGGHGSHGLSGMKARRHGGTKDDLTRSKGPPTRSQGKQGPQTSEDNKSKESSSYTTIHSL